MEPFFIKTFWITLIMLWIALILLYVILTNVKSLRKKGHSEKYIAYLRRSHTLRIILIAVILPLLILLSGWIVFLITGELNRESQLAYIVIVLVILVVPFKYIDEKINQRKIRELALEEGEQVAIDLNYRALHLIYHPVWEAILGPMTLAYGLFFLRIEQWIIYLFLLFPWFMYLNIRGTRYQTKPYMTDSYKYMFSFNIFSFLFFLFYFCIYYIQRIREFFYNGAAGLPREFSGSQVPFLLISIAGALIIVGLIGRIAVYISNYRRFVNEMRGEGEGMQSSQLRRWIIFIAFLIMVPAVSGLVVFLGGFDTEKIEVGVVQEKYMIDHSGPVPDTVMVVNISSGGNGGHVYPFSSGNHTVFGCDVLLSRSGRLVKYEICCRGLFSELPVGTIIKFEYGPGPSIQRLVEY